MTRKPTSPALGNEGPASSTLDDLVIRVPWFSRSQWRIVSQQSRDPRFAMSHGQWLKEARASLASIHGAGIRTCKVHVDAAAFIHWCRTQDQPVTSGALARYITVCTDEESS
jgi:hypothetical protein